MAAMEVLTQIISEASICKDLQLLNPAIIQEMESFDETKAE
jgi:hypothetical protein